MARPTFLPLTKSISIVPNAASGVHFTDLAGNTVNATYVQVATLQPNMSEEGDSNFFAVEPSGLLTGLGYSSTTSAVLPGETNASACVIGGANNPVVELSLGYKSTISSIKISNGLTSTTTFIVTYGHIKNSPAITDARILVDGSY